LGWRTLWLFNIAMKAAAHRNRWLKWWFTHFLWWFSIETRTIYRRQRLPHFQTKPWFFCYFSFTYQGFPFDPAKVLPSGNLLHSYGKSQVLISKYWAVSTAMLTYQMHFKPNIAQKLEMWGETNSNKLCSDTYLLQSCDHHAVCVNVERSEAAHSSFLSTGVQHRYCHCGALWPRVGSRAIKSDRCGTYRKSKLTIGILLVWRKWLRKNLASWIICIVSLNLRWVMTARRRCRTWARCSEACVRWLSSV